MPRNLHVSNTLPNVCISYNMLERVKVTKFLGILTDKNLTWKYNTALIFNKIAKNTGVIRRIRHLLPRKILLNLYYTGIYPYISYCNIVSASTFKATSAVYFLCKNVLSKMIMFSSRFTSSSPLFRSLRILPLFDLKHLQITIFVPKSSQLSASLFSKYISIQFTNPSLQHGVSQ